MADLLAGYLALQLKREYLGQAIPQRARARGGFYPVLCRGDYLAAPALAAAAYAA
jgi:hypothetical protein